MKRLLTKYNSFMGKSLVAADRRGFRGSKTENMTGAAAKSFVAKSWKAVGR